MITRIPPKLCGAFLLVLFGAGSFGRAQSVAVFARLDTNTIPVGGATVLHIQAQIVSNLRTNAERIFSWYVDVLNTNGTVAGAQVRLDDQAGLRQGSADLLLRFR